MTLTGTEVAALMAASAPLVTAIAGLVNVIMTRRQNRLMAYHAAEIRSDIAAQTDPAARQVADFANTVKAPE